MSCSSQEHNLNGKCYYIEYNPAGSLYPMASFIEFYNDSFRLIHYEIGMGGEMTYNIGLYSMSKDSKEIECGVSKEVGFSMNAGMVGAYREGCNDKIILELLSLDTIRRYRPHKRNVYDEEGLIIEQKAYEFIEYIEVEKTDSLFNYEWTYFMDKYDDSDRLQECK